MPSNHAESQSGYAAAGFEPIALDVDTIEPDAYPGQYEAAIDKVRYKPTAKDGKPMLVVDWKLTGLIEDSSDGNCEKSLGSIVSDFVVIAGDKSGNRGKIKLRHFRDEFSVEIPSVIASPEDLNELMAALKGQTSVVWVTAQKDADGNPRVNVHYSQPGGGGASALEMPDEDVKPKGKPAASKGKPPLPAKKTARR